MVKLVCQQCGRFFFVTVRPTDMRCGSCGSDNFKITYEKPIEDLKIFKADDKTIFKI